MALIPWITGIPNGPNDPSNDQPNMKQNNDNVPVYVAVDHVPFGVNNSGTHQQCTIKEQGTFPSIPSSVLNGFGTLYTQITANPIAGELFYVKGVGPTGIQLTGPYSPSALESGYTFLAGGILLQWGVTPTIPSKSSVNFNIAFPTKCFVVVAVEYTTAAPANQTCISIISKGTSGFQPRITTLGSSPSDSSAPILWIAVGN